MGYSVDLFKDKDIDSELICSICQDVMEDPVMLQDCEHIFCKGCIVEWFATSSSHTCPLDRERCDCTFRPPHRSFRNFIDRLQISCKFSGCSAFVRLDSKKDHEASCDHNPANADKLKSCPLQCGAELKVSELKGHNCVAYLKEQLGKKGGEMKEMEDKLKKDFTAKQLSLNTTIIQLRMKARKLKKKLRHGESVPLATLEEDKERKSATATTSTDKKSSSSSSTGTRRLGEQDGHEQMDTSAPPINEVVSRMGHLSLLSSSRPFISTGPPLYPTIGRVEIESDLGSGKRTVLRAKRRALNSDCTESDYQRLARESASAESL